MLTLDFSQIKRFNFSWEPVLGAEYYQLLESPAPEEPLVPFGEVMLVGESVSATMSLHFRFEASYVLRACNGAGCTDSESVGAAGSLAEAVGYFKASNTGRHDRFGNSVALSGDGSTLAVGAKWEDSSATGVGGDEDDDNELDSGAVYVFARNGKGLWSQQAYVKASNTDTYDYFGQSVALSNDGSTLAVGAHGEASNAGAVYVYARDGKGTWSQPAYIKASHADAGDEFGWSVALSGDGSILAVGAQDEDSNAISIDGDEANDSAGNAGAVYVFVRDDMDQWVQQAYVKASNTDEGDSFGGSVALSGDGSTLAVGAYNEDSNATGIGGDETNNSAIDAGAVYVFVHERIDHWVQQAYVKASNTGGGDIFGRIVALSEDGSTLAVGAYQEDSSAIGIGGNQVDDSRSWAGAVYVFVRDTKKGSWSQQAYVKASNTDEGDNFGGSVALSEGGSTLAVGASDNGLILFAGINNAESSGAIGIGGDQADNTEPEAGAVYVFVRDGNDTWFQQAYVKASNTDEGDKFGCSVALSDDGSTLAVGAFQESSEAIGISGMQNNDSKDSSGAVYLY
ncbi:MAG: integrin [Myxococcota bacterium]